MVVALRLPLPLLAAVQRGFLHAPVYQLFYMKTKLVERGDVQKVGKVLQRL